MRPFKHAVGTSSWNVAIVYAVVSYFLLAWPWSTPADAQVLRLIRRLDKCVGGEPCRVQPIISIVRSETEGIIVPTSGNIDEPVMVDFEGSVFVRMYPSPIGPSFIIPGQQEGSNMGQQEEPLRIGTCNSTDHCGIALDTDLIAMQHAVPFENGFASFSDLQIKRAGVGYVIRFVAMLPNGIPFAFLDCRDITVVPGEPYALRLMDSLGPALGGAVFPVQPTVSIVDRGGNAVLGINPTRKFRPSVSVTLDGIPESSGATLRPSAVSTAPIVDGVARFQGLYINEAGKSYRLKFTSNMNLPYNNEIYSQDFTVAIGPAYELRFIRRVMDAPIVQAGEFFQSPPRLEIRDKGGNLLIYDSDSKIEVSLYDNPNKGTLSPPDSLQALSTRGVVTFSALQLSTIGQGYRLKFDLFLWSPSLQRYVETEVTALSEFISVAPGPPRFIQTVQPASLAWAGGQEMEQQPILRIVDGGGNQLRYDSENQLYASLVSSLATHPGSRLKVNTSDATNYVINVSTNVEEGDAILGEGHDIVFDVSFLFEVWWVANIDGEFVVVDVERDGMGGNLPYLEILVNNRNYSSQFAYLVGNEVSQTRKLQFKYTVKAGDNIDTLTLSGPNAIFTSVSIENALIDGNTNLVDSTIPYSALTLDKEIKIDTNLTSITNVTILNTPDGEYGVGEGLEFQVTFLHRIEVSGSPQFVLPGSNFVADFTEVACDQYCVRFRYLVREGDSSPSVSVEGAYFSYVNSLTWIRRLSTNPTAAVQGIVPIDIATLFSEQHDVVIDSSRPELDEWFGLQLGPSTLDGMRYYTGDELSFLVKFKKPVELRGIGVVLLLDTGNALGAGAATVVGVLEDDATVEFKYRVRTGDDTRALSMVANGHAIQVFGEDTYLRRKVINGDCIQDADVATSDFHGQGSRLLDSYSPIDLYGKMAFVTSVEALGSGGSSLIGATVRADDELFVKVTFNTPVVTYCRPVLVIQSKQYRNAQYFSGNATNSLIFKYVIEIGDENPSALGLYYRHLPNALCVNDKYSPASDCSEIEVKPRLDDSQDQCGIFVYSKNSEQPVDTVMPWLGHSGADGMRVSGTEGLVIQPAPQLPRTTAILSAEFAIEPDFMEEISVGMDVFIDIIFRDDVLISFSQSSHKPKLLLNNGVQAVYFNGSETKRIRFFYRVRLNDDVEALDMMSLHGTTSAIICNGTCSMKNRLLQDVDISTASLPRLTPYIRVYTAQPQIINIWTDKAVAPYGGAYTIGEEVFIMVHFDREVVVSPFPPRLRLNIGNDDDGYAIYSEEKTKEWYANKNNMTVLVFSFTIGEDQVARSVTFKDLKAFDDNFGESHIYRYSTFPSLEVNFTIPREKNTLLRSRQNLGVDSTVVPRVVMVTSDAVNGTRYAAGDVINIFVHFDRLVTVTGFPYIIMDVGSGGGNDGYSIQPFLRRRRATYAGEQYPLSSKKLHFSYTVAPGDYNPRLDYADIHCLQEGITDLGTRAYIHQASTYPSPLGPVDLDLPRPGAPGSLSFGGNAIIVDGRPPYLTNIEIELRNQQSYSKSVGTNEFVYIRMDFTESVAVVGIPCLLMETGIFARCAFYDSGSGSSSIYFRYEPQPGDSSYGLDYYVDASNFNSAKDTLNLNGGAIMSYSANPVQPAQIHLNPTRGYLEGGIRLFFDEGLAEYSNLRISRRGPNYLIRFRSDIVSGPARTLSHTNVLTNSFSSEYRVMSEWGLPGHRIGHSVDIEGSIMIVGAPRTNLTVNDVQTITTDVSPTVELIPQVEIQVFRSVAYPQPEIQSFHTTANIGSEVGGSFKIIGKSGSATRPIPANANAELMKIYIMEDLPYLGVVSVTRIPHVFCACQNAFNWTITFHDLNMGLYPDLEFDVEDLTGDNAFISDIVHIQRAAYLRGEFTVKALGLESPPIPFDADDVDFTNALASVGLEATNIDVGAPDKARGKYWIVTFGALNGWYDVPTVEFGTSKLVGASQTDVWAFVQQAGRHGPITPGSGDSGLSGGFILTWRGNSTSFLPYNISAQDMKAALEKLPVINTVEVKRSPTASRAGFIWTVTFVSVNYHTDNGYFLDDASSFEPIEAENLLIGSDTSVIVQAKSSASMYSQFGPAVRGSYGDNAGAVYVYQRQPLSESWIEVAKLVGSDTDAMDEFGSSVSYNSQLLAVGAIGADIEGSYETHAILCRADDGFFTISFRGYTTRAIAHSVTLDDFIRILLLDLESLPHVTVDNWSEGGLCDSNLTSVTVTLHAFYDSVPTSATSDPFRVSSSSLLYDGQSELAYVNITMVKEGTKRSSGPGSDNAPSGAVYIFEQINNCDNFPTEDACLSSEWRQEAQIYPYESKGGEKFGFSVSLHVIPERTYVAIGAPSSRGEKGSVYIFARDIHHGAGAQWPIVQQLTADAWEAVAFDRFGYSVALRDSILAVGAPGRDDGRGAVFLFSLTPSQSDLFPKYTSLHVLPTSSVSVVQPLSLEPGDAFGTSIALDDITLVIGAPGRDESTVYLGSTLQGAEPNTGAVYVYHYDSNFTEFEYHHKLNPSNVKREDGFGWSVDIYDRSLIASGVRVHKEEILRPWKPMMTIRARANYNAQPVGNLFRLKWVIANDTGTWATRVTRFIKKDVTAYDLRRILEEDLGTGRLLVTRSPQNLYDGGYTWSITFIENWERHVPILEADTLRLTGTNASIDIDYVNPSPMPIRSLTHVFTRDSHDDFFVEKAYLSPHLYQPVDLCGYSIALFESTVVVGCPNRDVRVSQNNSGAAFAFDLSLLNFKYTEHEYLIKEGDVLTVAVDASFRNSIVEHHMYKPDILFYFETLDRNAKSYRQNFISHLFGLNDRVLQYPDTYVEASHLVGTAVCRTQYYGSSHYESVWVDGVYDYMAVSDYLEINDPAVILYGGDLITQIQIVTTPDSIFEIPDENATLVAYSPGFWPSVFGDLFATFRIIDDSDGYTTIVNITERDFQFDKLLLTNLATQFELGYAVAVDESASISLSSAPAAMVSSVVEAGVVVVYQFIDSLWRETIVLSSPFPAEGARFGDSVVVDQPYGRNVTTVAIGEPGQHKVYVFVTSTDMSIDIASFELEASIEIPGATLPQHHCARRGSLGIFGDILVVGAPGIEKVFIYKRNIHFNSDGSINGAWSLNKEIFVADYQYDAYNALHPTSFGRSVSVSGRTVAIGIPHIDYTCEVFEELVPDDENLVNPHDLNLGRGRVVLLDSDPLVVEVQLETRYLMDEGEFRLAVEHLGYNESTRNIKFKDEAIAMKEALEELHAIQMVHVNFDYFAVGDDGNKYVYRWAITFPLDWNTAPKIRLQWSDQECPDCEPFEEDAPTNSSTRLKYAISQELGDWRKGDELKARDRKRGDHFGMSVAIDGDLIVVGAPDSHSPTETTWDFERGSLVGWKVYGDAFSFQPTYGENCYSRKSTYSDTTGGINMIIPNAGSRCGPVGRYFVGTFDKRPGNKKDFLVPDLAYPQGGVQGDGPTGTMTSQPFMILGDQMNFLLGGGCNIDEEYVELLVDGLPVARATGKCSETMTRVVWDLSMFINRTGIIRIADLSDSKWGHINVDDFLFSWNNKGGQLDKAHQSTQGRDRDSAPFGSKIETGHSGAAYVFHRHIISTFYNYSTGLPDTELASYDLCPGSVFSECKWTQVSRLVPSDKRAYDHFGSSVAVSDAAGVVVVGSPYSSSSLLRPFGMLSLGGADGSSPWVYPQQRGDALESMPARTVTLDGNLSAHEGFQPWVSPRARIPEPKQSDRAGAVYIYTRRHKRVAVPRDIRPVSYTVSPEVYSWDYVEDAKIELPMASSFSGTEVFGVSTAGGGGAAGDLCGASVALSGELLTTGCAGSDIYQPDAGVTMVMKMGFAAVRFAQAEFRIAEDFDRGYATITVLRDTAVYNGSLTLEFATSDLTAEGVDEVKYQACRPLSVAERGLARCGDYEQTRGLLYIAPGVDRGTFTVRLVDDYCRESLVEYVQLSLSIPGSSFVLKGQHLLARLRIDDNDKENGFCL